MSYFPPYTNSTNKTEVELGLSIYAKKSDLKNTTGVSISHNLQKKMI